MFKIVFRSILFLGIIAISCSSDSPSTDSSDPIKSEKLTFKLEKVASDFDSPWGMAWLPNGNMLVTDRSGKLYKVVGNTNIEIGGLPEIYTRGQGGLLDIELHPNYKENKWIYISFSSKASNGGGNTRLIRAQLKNNKLTNIKEIFSATPNTKSGVHFGGRIEFDNDGYLYISAGERGERDNAQDLGNHSGKVHRLNDDGSIPKDNPFVNKKGAISSIFSYGHRNPQGLALHPTTGKIWEHEHGPKGGDEVNIVEAGKNYGWPKITYGVNYTGTKVSKYTELPGMEQPVTYWVPSIAPCGMDFVTSDKYPKWKNNLLVGSLKFQYLVRCEVKNNKVVHQEILLKDIGRVRCIRQAPDGYLYVSVEGVGAIYKIVPA